MTSEPPPGRPPPAGNEPVAVLIRVPAHADYLAIVRSAGAHLATTAGCTLPEIADLRLAVDEASSLLLRYTVRDRPFEGLAELECRFLLDDATLRVALSVPARDAARPDTDEFGWTVLGALVDDIVWQADGAAVRVEIVKRRVSGS